MGMSAAILTKYLSGLVTIRGLEAAGKPSSTCKTATAGEEEAQ